MPFPRGEIDWRQITLFLLTLGILLVCGFIILPFSSALLAAVVIAVVTQRPYDWLAARIRNPNAAASLAVILLLLALVVPTYFLAQDLGEQAFNAVAVLRSDPTQQKIVAFLNHHPVIAIRVQAAFDAIDLSHAARTSAAWVGTHFAGLLGNSFGAITQLVVMLFILFFLFRDRTLAISFLRSLLPLRLDETDELLQRVGDTIYATALGRLVIAAIQGVLAGLGYWALGVPGVILWAFSTAVFAMIPAFGAVLVWAPIALYLVFTGHWGKAILLGIWGGAVVSTIDNMLYPILIGGRLRTHTVVILIAILGGVAVFGLPGIIIGPVAFTIAGTLLDIWRARTTEPSAT